MVVQDVMNLLLLTLNLYYFLSIGNMYIHLLIWDQLLLSIRRYPDETISSNWSTTIHLHWWQHCHQWCRCPWLPNPEVPWSHVLPSTLAIIVVMSWVVISAVDSVLSHRSCGSCIKSWWHIVGDSDQECISKMQRSVESMYNFCSFCICCMVVLRIECTTGYISALHQVCIYMNLVEFWLHTKWIQHPMGSLLASVIQGSSVLTDSFKRLLPGACLLDWATGPSVQAHSQLGQLQCQRRCPCCDWLRKGAGMRSWAFNEPSTYFRIELEKLIWNKHREVTVFANLKKNQRCNLLTY